jgi:hypothetical protein
MVLLPILCLLTMSKDSHGNYWYSPYDVQETWYPKQESLSSTVPTVVFSEVGLW